jgi:hypothetical protein
MYRYKIRFVDRDNCEVLKDSGLVYGTCYSDAVKNLIEFYGETAIIEFWIFAVEGEEVIPDRFIDEAREEKIEV